MQTNLYQLYNRKLNGLTVFRALLEDVLIQRLQKLLPRLPRKAMRKRSPAPMVRLPLLYLRKM